MSRNKKDYATSDETRDVLRGNEQAIARIKNCNPSYIYNIKNMDEPDPYPPFREWFQQCAFGGAPVRIYLNDLESIAYQAEHGVKRHECLVKGSLEQICKSAERIQKLTIIIEDGEADDRECDEVLRIANDLEEEGKRLKELALNRKNEISAGRKASANGAGRR